MTTKEMLAARDSTVLEWQESHKGIDADGEPVAVPVRNRATVAEALLLQRSIYWGFGWRPGHPFDDEKMLENFISTRWAKVVNASKD